MYEHDLVLCNSLAVLQTKELFVNEDNDIDNLEIEASLGPSQSITYATVHGYGDLANGFDFDIFEDATYAKTLENIVMGDSLYGKIEWKNPVSDMTFYVKTCEYSCGPSPSSSAAIIKVS